MSILDKVKSLPNPMFVLFVSSKVIAGIGIGVLVSSCVKGFGWWILLLGIALSILPAIKVFSKENKG